MLVTKIFTFEAAHKLLNYDGKCANLHGHTYKLEVTVEGQIGDNSMVIDFGDVKKIVHEHVLEHVDHKYINDIIQQSTAENLIVWIWDKLSQRMNLYELKLWETPNSLVAYNGRNK